MVCPVHGLDQPAQQPSCNFLVHLRHCTLIEGDPVGSNVEDAQRRLGEFPIPLPPPAALSARGVRNAHAILANPDSLETAVLVRRIVDLTDAARLERRRQP